MRFGASYTQTFMLPCLRVSPVCRKPICRNYWPFDEYDLGEQWEVSTLGLRPFTSTNLPIPGTSGKKLALVPMPATCVSDSTSYKGVFNLLRMSTINERFKRSVWTDIIRLGIGAVPKPKSCATLRLVESPEEEGVWDLGDPEEFDGSKTFARKYPFSAEVEEVFDGEQRHLSENEKARTRSRKAERQSRRKSPNRANQIESQ